MSNKVQVKKIEIDLTDHCNLKCNCCDHSSNILPEKFNSVEEILADLKTISGAIEIEEILIAGGEPLLHKDLIQLLEGIKNDCGDIGKNVVLITNGVLLRKAPEKLWELVDGIWISVYPGIKISQENPSQFSDLAKKYNVWVWKKISDSFTKTLLNNKNDNDDITDFVYKTCIRTHLLDCHVVRKGRYYKCPPAVFMRDRLKMKGISFENESEDSIQIQDNPNLRDELEQYLTSDKPLKACSYCLGGLGVDLKHYQSNNPEVILNEDDTDIINSIHEDLRKEVCKAVKKGNKLREAGNIILSKLRKSRDHKDFINFTELTKKNIGKVFTMDPRSLGSKKGNEAENADMATESEDSLHQIKAFNFVLKHSKLLTFIYNYVPGVKKFM